MGQATLALRNFLIRVAIFVMLAALLAWAVGMLLAALVHGFWRPSGQKPLQAQPR